MTTKFYEKYDNKNICKYIMTLHPLLSLKKNELTAVGRVLWPVNPSSKLFTITQPVFKFYTEYHLVLEIFYIQMN